ncbi:MAG: glycosyltransferase family 4 protein [Pseudomonadota bacterium]
MPTRIFAFFQHWPPYSGAAALRGRSILLGLRDRDAAGETSLHVRTTTPDPVEFDRIEVETLPVGELENSEGIVKRVLGELRIGWIAAREILGKSGGCELLIISMPAYLAGIVLSFRARRKRVPYVLEVRDVYPQVYAGAGLIKRGSLIYRFFTRLSRRAYENAAAVVVATRGLERVVREDAPKANVQCVYNGFPGDFLTRSGDKHERFTACFHGVMGFFQDIETLIAVARELAQHDVDVVVIGYGRQESLLRGDVPANLRFLGRLPFEQTIETIERCHLGLCLRKDDPISRDAFPVKTWEYLGLGMPSIVTPHCEAGAFLEEKGCGFQLESGNVEAIVGQVLALKNNADALAALAARCRTVGADYTRKRLGAKAAEVFADTIR